MSNILSSKHSHVFDQGNPLAQKKILIATIFTALMMIAEISGGYIFNSMALLADGWHMSSHMLALGLAYVAYRAARHYADDQRFCFGTWKIEILAGYSSAILLILVAIVMCISSIQRFIHPVTIHYDQAIVIAVLGLAVNLICAWLLHDGHGHHGHSHGHSQSHSHSQHGHSHGHSQSHSHSHSHSQHQSHNHSHAQDQDHQKHSEQTHSHLQHQDLNQKAAFLHVLADAATSVLAIIALIAGKYFGWDFLDAVLGIVGAVLVAKWAWGLLQQSSKVLLDAEMDAPIVKEIYSVLNHLDADLEVMDLHVWQVGRGKYSCILSVQTSALTLCPVQIKQALSMHAEIVHASVELHFNTTSQSKLIHS